MSKIQQENNILQVVEGVSIKNQVAPQMATLQIPNATVILAPMDIAFLLNLDTGNDL